MNFAEVGEAERTEEHTAEDIPVLDTPAEGNLAAGIPAAGNLPFHNSPPADNLQQFHESNQIYHRSHKIITD